MSVDNVQGGDKTVTYIKGKPVLVEKKTSEKTTGSIMVSDETTVTSSSKTSPNQVVIFPKQEKAVKENGEIVFSKDMTDEQIENLQKLKDAQEFMKTDEGKKLAESMLNQQMDISKGQRKWLKKQGIDADAFVQEWNRQNPDSTNNKKFTKEKAEDARDEMAAYAKGFLGKQEMKANKPEQEEQKGLKGLFKKKEKEVVKKDTTFSDRGMKIKHHSSTDAGREDLIAHDVTDEIARDGSDFLNAFNKNADGKRRAKFTEIDNNGNDVTYKVRYNKDGSVKKVIVKSDETGKLSIKREKDGDITVKGDLQANYAIEDGQTIETINEKNVQKFEEVKTITNDNTYLQKDKLIIKERENCPDPYVPDISYEKLRGEMISDLPARDKVYNGSDGKKHTAVSGDTIREIAEEKGVAYLVKGYCGNPATAKYEASTEAFHGNLNQQNAKSMTGCFIHANLTTTKNGPAGREINERTPDYENLNDLINAAYSRDQEVIRIAGPDAKNQILAFIKLEIDEHNKNCKGGHAPNSNNTPLDMSKFPEWFQKLPNAVQQQVK